MERDSKLLSDEEPDFIEVEDDDDLDFNMHWNTDERPQGESSKWYERLEHDIDEALGEDGADFDEYDDIIADEDSLTDTGDWEE